MTGGASSLAATRATRGAPSAARCACAARSCSEAALPGSRDPPPRQPRPRQDAADVRARGARAVGGALVPACRAVLVGVADRVAPSPTCAPASPRTSACRPGGRRGRRAAREHARQPRALHTGGDDGRGGRLGGARRAQAITDARVVGALTRRPSSASGAAAPPPGSAAASGGGGGGGRRGGRRRGARADLARRCVLVAGAAAGGFYRGMVRHGQLGVLVGDTLAVRRPHRARRPVPTARCGRRGRRGRQRQGRIKGRRRRPRRLCHIPGRVERMRTRARGCASSTLGRMPRWPTGWRCRRGARRRCRSRAADTVPRRRRHHERRGRPLRPLKLLDGTGSAAGGSRVGASGEALMAYAVAGTGRPS